MPDISTVRDYMTKYSNWGRWGDDDELGTLNHVTPEIRARAASLVKSGRPFSLALPFDENGPQRGTFNRFNPIHLMTRDGADAIAGTLVRDFYGNHDRHFGATDDLVILPLQAGTQWDSLAHVIYQGQIYNGYSADQVSSKGALRNDITHAAVEPAGRGILLDIARLKGVDWLEGGTAITGDDLDAALEKQGITVQTGDFVLIRTGAMTEVRARGSWGEYAGGAAAGLGLEAIDWIARHEIAAVATDTWGMEVLPNQTPDVFQPLHLVLIVQMGLLVGEIWDLDALAADCADDGVYEFFFVGPALPFTNAVASPLNPLAIK
ncbi:cyclase family protein [Pseudolysinimonas kribbensis]|uniref:Cyclase n=1 Tax=Pseudolysinimonas kribbensis TaxID=433641 RepID=A0ABQ6KA13_9MICO|nr:cyclase family protein [Pseudolysinimonas kribbensis]GMA96204.1 cyclase [Pseudolysinimonas kribbensis]